jgi:hypothetical protein
MTRVVRYNVNRLCSAVNNGWAPPTPLGTLGDSAFDFFWNFGTDHF